MEIITYVVSGAVEHKDSMGNSLIIPAGEVQAMSAGSGITHSEFNPSDSEPLHLLQIWVFPQTDHVQPRYRQQAFSRESKLNQLRRIVSPDGSDSSLAIHQDMTLYASILESGYQIDFPIAPKRHVWIQLISGVLTINGQVLNVGDGAKISEESVLALKALETSEFLLFDLN